MRAGSAAKMVVGSLAVAGMLALSSPGVRVARAENGEAALSERYRSVVTSSGSSQSCKVGEQSDARSDRSAAFARIAEQIRAEMQSSDEKPVVLNGRGYNYKVARDPQLELRILQAEAARQREQASSER